MAKRRIYKWFLESHVVPKKQRIFVRKQFRELQKQYEFWDYLNGVFKRDQQRRCYYCGDKLKVTPVRAFNGEKREWEIDHKVPIYLGGTNVPFNLCIACKPCNRDKSTDLLERHMKTIKMSHKARQKKTKAGKVYF